MEMMAVASYLSHRMEHPSPCSSLPISFPKGEVFAVSPLRLPRGGHSLRTGKLHSIRSERGECSSTIPQDSNISRRTVLQTAVALCSSTAFLANDTLSKAFAEEDLPITRKVFFDVAIDGEPIGEIVVGLYGKDVPIGAQRFAELAVGKRGIGYRRKEFGKVTPTYIQNNGVRSFSLSGGDKDAANITGGSNNEEMAEEMAELDKKGTRPKNVAGAVSLFVVDPNKPPPKPKLIAKDGKFVYLEEESRPDPNATEFMIVTADSPQLDSSNLVVGRVVGGFDVIKKITQVKVVNENSSSPYFQTAKLIGDSRAIVAERGFYRPYSKIVITKSGEIREQPKEETLEPVNYASSQQS
ncbi:unnamed protein product [Calypogeia fissa]